MEEKTITAIQYFRSKSMQRVNSQRIFGFINKSALSIECINRLEIDGRVYIKKER